MERALYRNRSPLMRPEGAAVRFVSGCTDREKRKYTEACMWKATVLRGLFFSKVVRSSYLLNGWGKEFWRSTRGWTGWELGVINLNDHFFLWVREFFVLHRMVGRTWRGVLTPGYFEPCNSFTPNLNLQ